jgi:hypothetical protein
MEKQKISIPTMECDSDESWKHFADKMKSITRDLEHCCLYVKLHGTCNSTETEAV